MTVPTPDAAAQWQVTITQCLQHLAQRFGKLARFLFRFGFDRRSPVKTCTCDAQAVEFGGAIGAASEFVDGDMLVPEQLPIVIGKRGVGNAQPSRAFGAAKQGLDERRIATLCAYVSRQLCAPHSTDAGTRDIGYEFAIGLR